MSTNQVPLNKSLPAIDRKDRKFYDQLTDAERKEFSSYLMLRYAASIEHSNPDLVAYYIRAANEAANMYMFDLSRHPKLQWLMVSTVSPNVGSLKHKWIKHKKKEKTSTDENKKTLLELYPAMKEDDVDAWSKLVDKKELKQYVRDRGE